MTAAQKIDLDYEMKMTKELNIPNIQNITTKILDYYDKAIQRIDNIKNLAAKVLE